MAGRGGGAVQWSRGEGGHTGGSGGLSRGDWRVKRGMPSGALRCLGRTPPYCRPAAARAVSRDRDGSQGPDRPSMPG